MDPLSISPANRKNNTDICVYIDRLIDMLILFGKLIIIYNCTDFRNDELYLEASPQAPKYCYSFIKLSDNHGNYIHS